jgi:large subunit ribosomal protein L34e
MGVGTDSRVTFKRRHCYATRSNKIRKFRTPGGKISIQYTTKKAKGPACAVSKETLQGIPRLRPVHYKGIKKNKRTVTRAYGGCISASSLRDRIMRAFVVEEQKVRITGRREEGGRRAA